MNLAVVECWLLLVYVHIVVTIWGFESLYKTVQSERVNTIIPPANYSSALLCRAMDIASALYFENVSCLRRSAATALVLRRHGFAAVMVIGAQTLPTMYHAWVEIGAEIVNDKPYMPEIYQFLDRL